MILRSELKKEKKKIESTNQKKRNSRPIKTATKLLNCPDTTALESSGVGAEGEILGEIDQICTVSTGFNFISTLLPRT